MLFSTIEFISIQSSAAKGEDAPGMMEGTAEVPHPSAAAHLSEAAAVCDAATALDTALDMVGPQPPLVELLVRHVLLPREVLPQIERNSCAQASRSLGAIRGPGGVSASAILGTSVGGGTCNGVKMVWSSWGRRRRAGP